MRHYSIVWKLFFLILSLFTSFFLATYIGQTFFLEHYYIDKKVEVVSEELDEFIQHYKLKHYDYRGIQEDINEFYNRTNALVAIVDERGFVKSEASFSITVRVGRNEQIILPLNNALFSDHVEQLLQLDLAKGNKIHVKGLFYDGVIHPVLIKTEKERWVNQFANSITSASTIEFDGIVTAVALPTRVDVALPNKMNMFMRALQSWFISVKENQIQIESGHYDYTDSVNGIKNKVFVEPLQLPNGKYEYVFSLTSLQPVSEAMIVVKDFYIYAFTFLLLLLMAFAYYLSKWIAYPLLEMNDVTRRMAKLDFSKKIHLNRMDEIGELSESINEMSTNLEMTVEDLKIANQQLKKDIEMERRLEKTRKEFISGVSHELKTPLSIVKSYAEGIQDGIAGTRTDDYLTVIIDEVDKMEHLIGDMLDLARLESEGINLSMTAFNIAALIDKILKRMEFMHVEKQQQIHVEMTETLVIGDQLRIEQVLINFLKNAIQYSPHNEFIKIFTTEDEDTVCIHIQNYGVEIPKEEMEQLWDRFYRIDRARHRENGGTGLGLAITKTILTLHQSDYRVKSLKNGVEFSFTLKKF